MGEWRIAKIEDVAEKVAMGPFGSSIKVSTFVPDGIPIISGKHLNGIRVEDGDNNFITFSHAEKLRNANVERGDVIFTHAGNIGQVAYIPETSNYTRYVISQRQFYIRCKKDVLLPEFITYFFKGHEGQHKLLANASSTGVPSISRPVTYLRSIEIPLPPLLEQKRIAHILGTLDDKIELNRRMNETLEAMARALFKSWFIDFDPVIDNALRAGKPIPEELQDRAAIRADILNGNTPVPQNESPENHHSNLFPDEFQESELGWIPKGWEVSGIGKEVTVAGGATPSTKNPKFWNGGDIHWTTPKDLSGAASPILLETDRKITKDGLEKISSGLLPVDTVLMSSRAPVGYLALAKVPVAINQGYIAMKCGKKLSPSYVIQWANSTMYEIKQRAAGTTFAEISKKNFRTISVLVPEYKTLNFYSKMVNGYYDRITDNLRESSLLEKQRDIILPALLSGSGNMQKSMHLSSGKIRLDAKEYH